MESWQGVAAADRIARLLADSNVPRPEVLRLVEGRTSVIQAQFALVLD
ncbi:MAG: hypothetical protein M3R24_12045 [Chloroflexota bacterium]|nr:hypothetical protein [Chloroflexota bacterium]